MESTQGSEVSKPVLYHLSHTSSPALFLLSDKVSFFGGAALDCKCQISASQVPGITGVSQEIQLLVAYLNFD
jgi:hypothetical protein